MALVAIATTSCSSDEVYDVYGNPNNLVYLNVKQQSPANMPANTFGYTVYHTPVGPILASQPGDINISVKSTKNAQADIVVNLELKPDMVVDGYDMLPADAGVVVSLPEEPLVIPAGKTVSNTVKVNVDLTNADLSKLVKPFYLLPIKVASASSNSGQALGVTTQNELNAFYVGITTDVKTGMVNTVSNSTVGTPLSDYSGMTIVYYQTEIDWSSPSLDLSKLTDGNTYTYHYAISESNNSKYEEVIYKFDLGREIDLQCVQLIYYWSTYNIKDATVYTSLDGQNFTDQGTKDSNDGSTTWNLSFYKPIKTRYLHVKTHSASLTGNWNNNQILTEVKFFE